MLGFITTRSLKRLLAVLALLLPSSLLAAEDALTASALAALPALPAEYQALAYPEKIQWLEARLEKVDSRIERYRLNHELVFQYYQHEEIEKARAICRQDPPQSFDLSQRFVCLSVSELPYEAEINELLRLYDDALAGNRIELAVQTLSSLGWRQSSNGDIASAFQTYELALSYAGSIDELVATEIMLNTATLYVVNGDREYVDRGIQLQKETLERMIKKSQEQKKLHRYIPETIVLIQFNLGIAYVLHKHDYPRALEWFEKVKPDHPEFGRAALVFSALAASELGRNELAQTYLARSYLTPAAQQTNTDYLLCYQQLIEARVNKRTDVSRCVQLSEQTPLEVRLDIYKRMSKFDVAPIHLVGVEALSALFTSQLEPQLKQSAVRAASRAELIRLQQESQLRGELILKERALNQAAEEKRKDQNRFAVAVTVILLLVIGMVVNQLAQKRKLAAQYEQMSIADGLTGLNNRRYFEQNIERELSFVKRAQRNGHDVFLALYLFDIDHFKKINDSVGHDVGDQVLVEFARRIKAVVRDVDMVIRWGGEEFLLVSRVETLNAYHLLAERVRRCIVQMPFAVSDQLSLEVSCTIGATLYPAPWRAEAALPWRMLLQLADAALYYGKHQQRNCWVCVDDVPEEAVVEQVVSQGLEQALKTEALPISCSFSREV